MMTYLTMKMFCLQNRTDIVRVDKITHVLGTDIVVTFNDESSAHLRFADAKTADINYTQLNSYVTTPH